MNEKRVQSYANETHKAIKTPYSTVTGVSFCSNHLIFEVLRKQIAWEIPISSVSIVFKPLRFKRVVCPVNQSNLSTNTMPFICNILDPISLYFEPFSPQLLVCEYLTQSE